MARVKGPLFSQKASGKVGKTITFRCGQFVLLQPKKRKEMKEDELPEQMKAFRGGAYIWNNILTRDQKELWEIFSNKEKKNRARFSITTESGKFIIGIGQKTNYKECIETWAYNGYQYWQSCFIRFGPNGWIGYPNPPPID